MANELSEKKFTTGLSEWTNTLTGLVTADFETCGVQFDEYSKQCAMNAMSSIFQLVKADEKTNISEIDTSNLREVVGQCASLKLNANAVPRECYFSLRSKKIDGKYVKVVEMGIEGDGNDALLKNYGEGVKEVFPCWIVKEGDVFAYPKHRGIEVTPPEWEEMGKSDKVTRIVYPVLLVDNSVVYLISERDSVKTNLMAHIRNNMLNETFGVCENRYKASDKQKEEIAAKKEVIFEELRKCETLEDMLSCESAKPFISAAWLDTPESMIVRKMRNNAIKKFRKNYNQMAKQSMLQLDESYQVMQEEIAENENSIPFEIDEATIIDSEDVK
jgi:hypothetical protein